MKKIFSKGHPLLWILPILFIANVGFFNTPPTDNYFEISKNMDIFGKLFKEVNASYVDDVEPSKFMRTGIDAMLKTLDPYTNFIGASEIEDYRFFSTGQYGGIGAVISKRDKVMLITEPYEGDPADKAGLRAGDQIIQIDDEVLDADKVGTLDVRNLLRGQAGTIVKIKIIREGKAEPFVVEVERNDIKIKNVPYSGMIDDKTGYISLTGFMQDAAKEVKEALENLRRENPAIESLVLDLRGNPGGLLFEAIDISNLFVAQGEKIVETRGKIEGSVKSYSAKYKPIDQNVDIAVLINRRSASASEIVSGVMQDLDRGVIVGQQSFGKGLVQTTRPLSYNSQLKITTAKYYTPSGRCIQAIDYSNRNEDGSVGKFPDSLKKAFQTKGGRTVYDGGGVEPDLEVKIPDYHTVTRELLKQDIIFDFATIFRSKNDSIPSSRNFAITDEIYKNFLAYANERGFKFESKTEKEFTKLMEQMKEEAYFDDLETEITAIQTKIDKEKANDLFNYKVEISNFLKSEIVKRYYFRSGEIEASFDMDPDVLEAIKVLKNKEAYKKILETKG